MDNNKVVLHSRLDVAFSLNYFSFFIVNFVHLKLLFFTLDIFIFFLSENKPNMCNNIIDISSFQNGLIDLFSSTGFYFKSKVIESSHKGKNMFFNLCTLLLKTYIFEVVTFFSCIVVIQSTQFFSGSTYL